ncbi:hypothetical protein FK85_23390 [Halorubrum saccharovorum]|uniref:Uncharacterized protein n=1 Tax=Halorubrum saccharovorum TaxID=2248 RepID=A0A0F8AVY7_9EURY|nr:hypothetical protein FK85_23390 [Halorubrum saccharovorum]
MDTLELDADRFAGGLHHFCEYLSPHDCPRENCATTFIRERLDHEPVVDEIMDDARVNRETPIIVPFVRF